MNPGENKEVSTRKTYEYSENFSTRQYSDQKLGCGLSKKKKGKCRLRTRTRQNCKGHTATGEPPRSNRRQGSPQGDCWRSLETGRSCSCSAVHFERIQPRATYHMQRSCYWPRGKTRIQTRTHCRNSVPTAERWGPWEYLSAMCFYIRQLKKVCEKTTCPIDNDLSELHDAEVHVYSESFSCIDSVFSESGELKERRRQSNVRQSMRRWSCALPWWWHKNLWSTNSFCFPHISRWNNKRDQETQRRLDYIRSKKVMGNNSPNKPVLSECMSWERWTKDRFLPRNH